MGEANRRQFGLSGQVRARYDLAPSLPRYPSLSAGVEPADYELGAFSDFAALRDLAMMRVLLARMEGQAATTGSA